MPPAKTVRIDGDDPYFVVAADKGTATFSDTANAPAQEADLQPRGPCEVREEDDVQPERGGLVRAEPELARAGDHRGEHDDVDDERGREHEHLQSIEPAGGKGGVARRDRVHEKRDDDDEHAPREPLEPRRPLFARHLRERRPPGGTAPIRRLKLRHFAPEELDEALSHCGLSLHERYGRFDGKPFDLQDSRQIGVATL